MKRALIISTTVALCAPGLLYAQSNGRQIATQGVPPNVAPCASCHGTNGEGNAAAGFPRIAGQSAIYLTHQLASYADGSRRSANPIMLQIAKSLNAEQRAAVSAYYAGLKSAPSTSSKTTASSGNSRGEILSRYGDEKIKVQACANCHGPGGIGGAPTYPYLAGQHSSYLLTALKEWKDGSRNNDSSQQMQMIARQLSDRDVQALAQYFSAQPAPPSAAAQQQPAQSPQPNTARFTHSGPPTGAKAVKGAGAEQGAPTTGGAQGPGGGGGASGSGAQGSPGDRPQH